MGVGALSLRIGHHEVAVQVLDTPGRREMAPLLVPFYRQCAAVALVFDTGSLASF